MADYSPMGKAMEARDLTSSPLGHWAGSVRGHFRSPGRPRLWVELLLIAVSYWIYSMVRNAVPEMETRAQQNAHDIWSLEQTLHIDVERSINHGLDSIGWLITGLDYDYATLHFIVTIAVLVWLFRAHSGRYAAARLSLFVTTGMALVGYYFFPLAPPRLMTHGGFVDTVATHHTWGSMASGDMAHVSNQFAAMPSMHIGWSLWCGITIWFLAKRRWVRVLGVIYPVTTLVVIVATANHFFMDAIAGAVCTGIGLTSSRLVYRRWPYSFPKAAPVPTPLPEPVKEPVGASR
ncbi:phosphatase PAP2 family protein [Streptacidiphilus sp. MAP5-3]|uniref:phosphatase PAP2 family protein n=1 Tax=unclassified Streptacidiphilus TaxID=2643834 RepID=UPI003511983B